jgi:hypothetical protein
MAKKIKVSISLDFERALKDAAAYERDELLNLRIAPTIHARK